MRLKYYLTPRSDKTTSVELVGLISYGSFGSYFILVQGVDAACPIGFVLFYLMMMKENFFIGLLFSEANQTTDFNFFNNFYPFLHLMTISEQGRF